MQRNTKRSLKEIRKELKYYGKEYDESENDYTYEYLLMLSNRYRRMKNGSKGS